MPIYKTTPEEIIKNSIVVFWKNGYYRTTMNDLATATGLTKGVFYHHFSSKEDIMKRCLEVTFQWFDKKIFSIAYNNALSKQERLVKMSDVLFEAFTKNSGGCFFANTILETVNVEETFVPEINLFFESFENALRNIFKEKYKEEQLTEVVQQIMADIEGTILIMQIKKDSNLLRASLKRGIQKL
jgi:TetR/AcrR family transcriptional regulator, transcriptional repressor for nem operon